MWQYWPLALNVSKLGLVQLPMALQGKRAFKIQERARQNPCSVHSLLLMHKGLTNFLQPATNHSPCF